MLSYCLKCKKNTESINPIVSKFYQNASYVAAKNQYLLKSKKQKDY